MEWSKISICYYPTTVVFVDDQKSFLNEMDLGLDETIVRKFYDDPKELMEMLQLYSTSHFIKSCIIMNEDTQNGECITHSINIKLLYQKIYNPKRFDQISVLVADYAMPSINGLDCCTAIQNTYIKKMLLTGEADNNAAVEAFNARIIDKFIQKGSSNLISIMNQSVKDLQMRYFLDLSEKLQGVTSNQINKCLNNPDFIRLFYKFCREHQILEYYLLDNHGSFLMLDKNAQAYWLIIKSEQEIENLYRHAEIERAPSAVIDALRSREKIPYFHADKDLEIPPAQWEKYLHPAQKLESKDNYFYAFIKNEKSCLDSNKICSYQQFWEAQS